MADRGADGNTTVSRFELANIREKPIITPDYVGKKSTMLGLELTQRSRPFGRTDQVQRSAAWEEPAGLVGGGRQLSEAATAAAKEQPRAEQEQR